MRDRGLMPATVVLSASEEAADDDVSYALRIRPGRPVIRVERLRTADGTPMAYEVGYYPSILFPGLLQRELGALYDVFASEYGVVVTSGEQTVRAESADAQQAGLLGIAKRAPLLVQERVTYAGRAGRSSCPPPGTGPIATGSTWPSRRVARGGLLAQITSRCGGAAAHVLARAVAGSPRGRMWRLSLVTRVERVVALPVRPDRRSAAGLHGAVGGFVSRLISLRDHGSTVMVPSTSGRRLQLASRAALGVDLRLVLAVSPGWFAGLRVARSSAAATREFLASMRSGDRPLRIGRPGVERRLGACRVPMATSSPSDRPRLEGGVGHGPLLAGDAHRRPADCGAAFDQPRRGPGHPGRTGTGVLGRPARGRPPGPGQLS